MGAAGDLMRAGPLLLAEPSPLARLSHGRARWLLGTLFLLLLASLSALVTADLDRGAPADGQSDVLLYSGIVEGVRHGGRYYTVAADALRAGDYPLKPFVAIRPPTLAVISAAVPPVVLHGLLWTLILGVAVAWHGRLSPILAARPTRVLATLLLLAGMAAAMQPTVILFHEAWAGLLIALSLALRRPGDATQAIAMGLAAMVIRETAALYGLLMAALAWRDGYGREAAGWAAALAVLAAVVACHAWAVAGVVQPLDLSSPGWMGLQGPGFAARALATTTGLALLPLWLAALLIPFAVAGWAGWKDPMAIRAGGTLAAYLALLAGFARPDNFYWALLVAPGSLVALLFAPDALRDLLRASRDGRRITVTRTAREGALREGAEP